eukprot:m.239935 g.239935  ORF g.239935 m.239935 type:complete len:115 (+) comp17434_c0_seq27:1067-1411(+)
MVAKLPTFFQPKALLTTPLLWAFKYNIRLKKVSLLPIITLFLTPACLSQPITPSSPRPPYQRVHLPYNPCLVQVKAPMIEKDGGWVPNVTSRFFTDDVAHGTSLKGHQFSCLLA